MVQPSVHSNCIWLYYVHYNQIILSVQQDVIRWYNIWYYRCTTSCTNIVPQMYCEIAYAYMQIESDVRHDVHLVVHIVVPSMYTNEDVHLLYNGCTSVVHLTYIHNSRCTTHVQRMYNHYFRCTSDVHLDVHLTWELGLMYIGCTSRCTSDVHLANSVVHQLPPFLLMISNGRLWVLVRSVCLVADSCSLDASLAAHFPAASMLWALDAGAAPQPCATMQHGVFCDAPWCDFGCLVCVARLLCGCLWVMLRRECVNLGIVLRTPVTKSIDVVFFEFISI